MTIIMAWVARNPLTAALLGVTLTLGVLLGVEKARSKVLDLRVKNLTTEIETANKLLEGQRIITDAKAKQAQIAWDEVGRLRKKGQERKVVIQTVTIPSDCPGAVQWGAENVNSLTQGWR